MGLSQSVSEPEQAVEIVIEQGSPTLRAEPSTRVESAAPQAPPAGWFPDPSGGGGLRWWDGTAWSEHRITSAPVGAEPPALRSADMGVPDSHIAVGSRDLTTPATRTSIDGYLIAIEYDEQSLRIRGKNAVARVALAGPDHGKGDVVIPREAIARATFQAANPLVNGKVVVTTSDGHAYQLHFRRKQQADFERLAHDLGA